MNYRLYQAGDFPPLYAIEEICFPPLLRFGRRYMRSLIAHPSSATWIAEDAGAMAGFAIVHWSGMPPRRSAYVQTLEVHPDSRRRGIASELLRRLEHSAIQAGSSLIWLHVDAANQPAISLYRDTGYERQGTRQDYYGEGLPADIYAKQIEPAVASPGFPATE